MATRLTGVTLHVTELKVPSERLKTVDLAARVCELAGKDSRKGLIDEGGAMKVNAGATVLATGHYNGFISAATNAFAQHYPLSLAPQHVWLLICQAVAKHVELNAESVRSKWVAHDGKKELLVRRDHFVLGRANDWEGVIAAEDGFASQIKKNTVDGVAEALTPGFSGASDAERVAMMVTAMDMTKSFFSFKCMTCCGFPSVTMEGTADDWRLLRENALRLVSERCEPGWGAAWLASLAPLLDKLNAEYDAGGRGGKGDEKFWNSMCKRGGTSGSGACTWFNGWVNILFPYIQDQPNRYTVPYSPSNGYVKEGRDGGQYGMHAPSDVQGPDCADFPTGVAAAPVTWDYLGAEHKLLFKAGFVGATQDAATGTVRPSVGWYICHDDGDEPSVMDDPVRRFESAGRRTRPPPRSGFTRQP